MLKKMKLVSFLPYFQFFSSLDLSKYFYFRFYKLKNGLILVPFYLYLCLN